MPPKSIRVTLFVILIILCSSMSMNAQSDLHQWLADNADETETTTFRIDDYDVISSIYVFLTSEDEKKHWLVLSLEPVETGGGDPAPLPCSLDNMFRTAIIEAIADGNIPGAGQSLPLILKVRTMIEAEEDSLLLPLLPDEANLKVWTYSFLCLNLNIPPILTGIHVEYQEDIATW